MKKKIANAVFALSLLSMSSIPAAAESVPTSVGTEIGDANRIVDGVRDGLSYFLSYETSLNNDTVISALTKDGDVVPDGVGPSGNPNELISSLPSYISLSDKPYRSSYCLTDDFTIPALKEDYYTFLGWQYDYSSLFGEMGTSSSPDFMDSLKTDISIDKGSIGSRHYTAYWRQNYLNILLNAGKDVNGVISHNEGDSAYTIGGDGLISKNGKSKFNAQGSEGSITIEGPQNKSSLNLVLDDYHIDSGKEWISEDGNVFVKDKTYYVTAIAEDIKDGDVTKTLTANWQPNVYTLTFDMGKVSPSVTDTASYKPVFASEKNSDDYAVSTTGGTFNKYSATQNYTYETRGTLPAPTLDDYEFNGWFASDGTEVKTYEDLIGLTEANGRNITITAKWSPVTFTITYDLDKNDLPDTLGVSKDEVVPLMDGFEIEGSYNTYATSATYNVEQTGSLPTPKRDYYVFKGWYYGDRKVSTFKELYDASKIGGRECVVEALWAPYEYKITYDNKGNRPGMVNTVTNNNLTTYTVETLNDAKNKLSNATCKGYVFKNWLADIDGKTVEISELSELPFKDATIKADWDIITYTVTYSSSDLTANEWKWAGTSLAAVNSAINSKNTRKTYNAEDTFSLVNPSMSHETFKGWTGSGTGTSVTIKKGTTGNLSFTATWAQAHTCEWKTTKDSTCTATGVKKYTCKVCGTVTETGTIALKAHTRVNVAHKHDIHSCPTAHVANVSQDTGWYEGKDIDRQEAKQRAVNVFNQTLSNCGVTGISYSKDEFGNVGWQDGQWTSVARKYGSNGFADVSMYLHGVKDGKKKKWHSIANINVFKLNCTKTIDYYYCKVCGKKNY